MLAADPFGLPIPDAEPVFAVLLAGHVVGGLAAVIAGALAATAGKRPGRRPRAGRVYLWALGAVVTTAALMAAIRWPADIPLLGIAVAAGLLGGYGYLARRPRRGWVTRYAIGMGGSYIALLTGFYVDNGPHLPLWNRLPDPALWLLPSLIGAPLIWLAVQRLKVPHTSIRTEPEHQHPLARMSAIGSAPQHGGSWFDAQHILTQCFLSHLMSGITDRRLNGVTHDRCPSPARAAGPVHRPAGRLTHRGDESRPPVLRHLRA